MLDTVRLFDDSGWGREGTDGPTRGVEAVVESGAVLCFPRLRFELADDERRLLDSGVADGKSKNISLRGPGGDVRGAAPEYADALGQMMRRFRAQATSFAERLFPHYRGALRMGNTSFRPVAIEGRQTSWRKDDTRLHVDAFPSNPMQGDRLLRVFHNLNPHGRPRHWRIGEPFEDFARRFLPAIPPPRPGSAALLYALRITKSRRTPYDHYMLHLHDLAKADADYQRNAPQSEFDFTPGTTWVVYSDQVLHAAMSGQFMMEQTFYLAPSRLADVTSAPVHVLQRLLGRPLL